MRVQLELLGLKDVQEFVSICEGQNGKKELYCPSNNYRVNATSILGCLAALEWNNLWLESDEDFYSKIEKWVVLGEDGEYIHD